MKAKPKVSYTVLNYKKGTELDEAGKTKAMTFLKKALSVYLKQQVIYDNNTESLTIEILFEK